MLWLALYCPTLALDCILRRWPSGVEPAIAVSETDGSRRFVAAATRTAEACGVCVGQSVSTALALVPDLVVVARKLEDERAALIDAALAALRFTPTVSLRPAGLVMEISASLRLFGGRRAFKASLAEAMRTQGLGIAAAEAPTPHGAWLLAKWKALRRLQDTEATRRPSADQPFPVRPKQATAAATFDTALGAVPIGLLESLESTSHKLVGVGVHKLRDLRRLPTGGLARRFGHELLDELARARGERPDPQTIFEAPSSFEARIELMARVDNAEALVFASQRLLEQMAGWLTARRAAVRGFSLVMHHDRWKRDAIEPTTVPIAVATPSSDSRRLLSLVRERLSRLELKAAVLELSIEAPAIIEEQEKPGFLFAGRERATNMLARLLEKLIARLGEEAMSRIERVEDHRPERAWREVAGAVMEETALLRDATSTLVPDGHRRAAQKLGNTDSLVDVHAGVGTRIATGRDSEVIIAIRRAAQPNIGFGFGTSDAAREKNWIFLGPGTGARSDIVTNTVSMIMASIDDRAIRINRPRPAWLLPEPRALEMQNDRPAHESLPLFFLTAPERVEVAWWDNAVATRDYFMAQNSTGHLVWIYRERILRPDKPLWYVQGLFT